jgi:hypothetical protein
VSGVRGGSIVKAWKQFVLSIGCGIGLSYLVAAGCAVIPLHLGGGFRFITSDLYDRVERSGEITRITVGSMPGCERAIGVQVFRPGYLTPEQPPPWWVAEMLPVERPGDAVRHSVQVSGWPARCTWCTFVIRRSDDPLRWETGFFEADVAGGVSLSGRKPVSDQGTMGVQSAFPIVGLRPLPIGLVLNTAFYGGGIWLIWFAPGAVRRMFRRRRGACVRCGYDLRGVGNVMCPECGGERTAVRTAAPTTMA